MFKKVKTSISLVVLLSFLVSILTPCTFASKDQLPNELSIKFEKGKYVISNDVSSIKVKQAKEPGIYSSKDNQYFSYTGTKYLQPVTKTTVLLYNKAQVISSINQLNLTNEVKKDILNLSSKAITSKSKNATLNIYTLIEPMIRGNYDINYTYNGKKMKDTYIYAFGLDTGMRDIQKGAVSKDFANLTIDIALSAVGFVERLSLVAGGISLFRSWCNYVNATNVTGSSEDFVQMEINYDVSTKYTYCDLGSGWQIGCVTQNVYINEINTIQYYKNASYGKTYHIKETPKKTVTSPNFNNPAPIAISHITNPINERLSTTIGQLTFWY